MTLVLLNVSVSSAVLNPEVIETVADASVVLSTSTNVIAVSIATGVEVTLLPSVKAVVPPLVVSIGASFAPVTFTVKVAFPVNGVAFPSVAVTLNVSLAFVDRASIALSLGT